MCILRISPRSLREKGTCHRGVSRREGVLGAGLIGRVFADRQGSFLVNLGTTSPAISIFYHLGLDHSDASRAWALRSRTWTEEGHKGAGVCRLGPGLRPNVGRRYGDRYFKH